MQFVPGAFQIVALLASCGRWGHRPRLPPRLVSPPTGDNLKLHPLFRNIKLVRNYGFKKSEIRIIETIIEENKEVIVERWVEFFNNK
ncbi:DUF4160 domain-containing protein (plasmid) [Pedobacter sp. BS3]|nr:DUF4160 domain-containing protein [Pedobacter sp. BS3]